MPRRKPAEFTVTDGDLVLTLQPAGKGWYAVSSPMEPHLHTQAKSIEEAFEMARDAIKCLREARLKYHKETARALAS